MPIKCAIVCCIAGLLASTAQAASDDVQSSRHSQRDTWGAGPIPFTFAEAVKKEGPIPGTDPTQRFAAPVTSVSSVKLVPPATAPREPVVPFVAHIAFKPDR
jgi:hypothetical protein